MRTELKSFLTVLSATVFMVSTLGTLVWLGALFVVAFTERGLSFLGILPPHWDVEHMTTTMTIASVLAVPAVAWLAAWFFRTAWQAERELNRPPKPPL